MFASTDKLSFAAHLDMLSGLDLRGDLGAVTAPVLVLSGSLDQLRPPEQGAEIAGLFSNAQMDTLRAAHMPAWQAPADFLATTTAFLKQHIRPEA